MMLVDDLVVSRLCIDVFRWIERLLSTIVFYFPVGKVTAPELDNNAPLAVGFFGDRVIIQDHIIVFVQRQSTWSVFDARARTCFELAKGKSANHVLAVDELLYLL